MNSQFDRYEGRSHRDGKYRYETDESHYEKDDARYERSRRRNDRDRDREREQYNRHHDDRYYRSKDDHEERGEISLFNKQTFNMNFLS